MPTKIKRKSARKKRKPKKHTNVIKVLDETSRKFAGSFSPTNVREQKERFFKYGLTPEFSFSKGRNAIDVDIQLQKNKRQAIRTDYFHHAKAILDKVKTQYKDGMRLMEIMYGERITQQEATAYIEEYIKEHDLVGQIAIYWSPALTGSAKMCWRGPAARCNKPGQRTFSLVVKNAADNVFLSETGIKCLMNHEIGTHYFRAYNDGFQPWYTDRKKFGLHGYTTRASVSSEEGLACLNTALNAKTKYLWGSALAYYTSCMAAELSFGELFEHLEEYVNSADYRWKLCLRVKRAISNTDCVGGIGHDQVYFEGAVNILSNIDDIDLAAMFSGRVSYDETTRAKRLARGDCLRLPAFMKDMDRYRYMLKYIAFVNGLADKPPLPSPHKSIPICDSKFDYEAFQQRRDGKSKKKFKVDGPFMYFAWGDAPVQQQTSATFPSTLITSIQDTPQSTRTSTQDTAQSTRKDFLYPLSPVPSVHYVQLRQIVHPDLNLDLDTSRSMTSITKLAKVSSVSDRSAPTGHRQLPESVCVSDRYWQKQ